ncbi:MAG: helicase-like protein [Bacteriovoracaceae bacterium]|nr:helicase-like protein [Bacteriovoracaceae bacterium]
MKTIQLTLDQEQAFLNLKENRRNLFITGGAGTGKSFLIQYFLRSQVEKIPVLASTGAAAIIVGGRTFHSFFGLGRMQGGPEQVFTEALKNKRLKKRLNQVSRLIIDEISMISFDTLDVAEKIARALRANDEPWGGLRIVAVGDFAQLPPVSQSRSKEWAFLGEAWAASEFKILHLTEVMRTEDTDFMAVLSDLRYGKSSVRLKHFLKTHTRQEVDGDVTRLFPRRDQTEAFNLGRLAEIPEISRRYETIYSGEQRYLERVQRDAPIPAVLELKKGALVMIRVNDSKQRYVNGTTGRVIALKDEVVTIETDRRTLEIEPFTYSVQNEDGQEVAFAKNFPLNLAYASTIHKIQGATLDKVHIDLLGLWEPGQAYVALSRARRGDDVTISRWSERSILADPMVKSFYGIEVEVPISEEYFSEEFNQV